MCLLRGALKPISTLPRPLPTADLITAELTNAFYERADVCVVPAASVIGEAMVSIVLADAALEKFGGDHLSEFVRNYEGYRKTIGPRGDCTTQVTLPWFKRRVVVRGVKELLTVTWKVMVTLLPAGRVNPGPDGGTKTVSPDCAGAGGGANCF